MKTAGHHSKIFDPESGQNLDQWLARFDRPIVFTNGCFDILHLGHVDYLERAAGMGKSLVVGVNSDQSVQRQGKEPSRPFNTLGDRMHVLAALACIDGVVAFDQDTPLELILAIRPDILVKGGDWPVSEIVGGAEVEGWGGSVHSLEFHFQRSTSRLVDKIRKSLNR